MFKHWTDPFRQWGSNLICVEAFNVSAGVSGVWLGWIYGGYSEREESFASSCVCVSWPRGKYAETPRLYIALACQLVRQPEC